MDKLICYVPRDRDLTVLERSYNRRKYIVTIQRLKAATDCTRYKVQDQCMETPYSQSPTKLLDIKTVGEEMEDLKSSVGSLMGTLEERLSTVIGSLTNSCDKNHRTDRGETRKKPSKKSEKKARRAAKVACIQSVVGLTTSLSYSEQTRDKVENRRLGDDFKVDSPRLTDLTKLVLTNVYEEDMRSFPNGVPKTRACKMLPRPVVSLAGEQLRFKNICEAGIRLSAAIKRILQNSSKIDAEPTTWCKCEICSTFDARWTAILNWNLWTLWTAWHPNPKLWKPQLGIQGDANLTTFEARVLGEEKARAAKKMKMINSLASGKPNQQPKAPKAQGLANRSMVEPKREKKPAPEPRDYWDY